MKTIKDVDKELQSLNKEIVDNLNKLSQYPNNDNAQDVIVGADCQVVSPTTVQHDTCQNINILRHKLYELIKQREKKWQEFLSACDVEYKSQIRRAESLHMQECVVETLKTVCSEDSRINILKAVESLKEKIDAFEFGINYYH